MTAFSLFAALQVLSSFCAICSAFVSHGIRQRNSSVPLRELVDTSRATALIAPIQGPAGRQAIFGIEECPYCDPKKCLSARPGGRIGLCLTIRDGDGLLVANRCVGSRKELNRAMSVRQMAPTARSRRQGCERSGAKTVAEEGAEDDGAGEAEGEGEELCWCETAHHRKSLLEEGLTSPDRASSIRHARRRKNHHGIVPTSHKKDEDEEEQQPEQRQHQKKKPHLTDGKAPGDENAAGRSNQWGGQKSDRRKSAATARGRAPLVQQLISATVATVISSSTLLLSCQYFLSDQRIGIL